jgi:hypothetical protein
MSDFLQNDLKSDRVTLQDEDSTSHRYRDIHVLFIHHDARVIDDCRRELAKARFVVTADMVLTLEQGVQRIAEFTRQSR